MADKSNEGPAEPTVRKGQLAVNLSEREFTERWLRRFDDPAFDAVRSELLAVAKVAFDGHHAYRKSPRHRKAGTGFADPEMDLPAEWLEARERIHAAQRRHDAPASPSRILLVCGSARNDWTCPGEISKTFRLVNLAKETIEREAASPVEVEVLDLSRQTAEFGIAIHPCKACVSTAQPLCHWPCSCYPNHAMGQVSDWMADIYPMWVAAHGVMIVTPVNWYQAPSVLKLMIDRLVCADGGNPDPTTTRGKNPLLAKKLELAGWSYPKHLKGRAFSVVVHGDASGVETLRRILCDWLTDMELVPAGSAAQVGAYVGYLGSYATSPKIWTPTRGSRMKSKTRLAASQEW